MTVRRPVLRIAAETTQQRPDTLAAEEPLEIRIGGEALTVTMRTPGHDLELAHGFLLTESVVTTPEDVSLARYCDSPGPDGRNTYNVLDVLLTSGITASGTGAQRNFYTSSSCGVCGKAALDAVRQQTSYPPDGESFRVHTDTLRELPGRLRTAQRVFASTGGLHAAGVFDTAGEALVVREDVGRHNAVDKALGWALLQRRVPLEDTVLLVSGRASFELVQKAAMAGIPVLSAVSAPSSLAVELATEQNMTLVGFLRGETMNIYTGAQRVLVE